jgi:large subunit ribosomal protein L21
MYAIFVDGGRQYKVSEGQILDLDYRDVANGETIRLDRVLCVSDGSTVKLGEPHIAGAAVSAEVIGPQKGGKLVVQKFRRRKNYRRRTGHRQIYTRVKINKIEGI